ncbi:Rv2231c family pyridoxal phosphate-dependent protein CobC [Mycolicibacillus trivialis]
MASLDVSAPRYHGDQAVTPGMLDFAVNVRHRRPPAWLLDRLAGRLPDLARYPGAADRDAATAAVAARHGRDPDEVLLLAGAAEGFALLPQLEPNLAALLAPSFTEPQAVFDAAGVPYRHVVLAPPFTLAGAAVPEEADLVVVGNPTNPTAVSHPRDHVLALRRPGRIVVVDEAFADAVPGEPDSLAGVSLPDVVVLRSLTKTWGLAGLRVGYAVGPPDVLARLAARRPHWPLGTLQLAAVAACCAPRAVAEAAADAERLAGLRRQMVAGLHAAGCAVVAGQAPFVLFTVEDAARARGHLAARDIAVRRCDTFVGLDGHYLRAAVRPEWPALAAALTELPERRRIS